MILIWMGFTVWIFAAFWRIFCLCVRQSLRRKWSNARGMTTVKTLNESEKVLVFKLQFTFVLCVVAAAAAYCCQYCMLKNGLFCSLKYSACNVLNVQHSMWFFNSFANSIKRTKETNCNWMAPRKYSICRWGLHNNSGRNLWFRMSNNNN